MPSPSAIHEGDLCLVGTGSLCGLNTITAELAADQHGDEAEPRPALKGRATMLAAPACSLPSLLVASVH